MSSTSTQLITLLGATGSVGDSTLDVISRHPNKYSLFALTGNRQLDKLAIQCATYRPEYAVVNDSDAADKLSDLISHLNCATKVLWGTDALCDVSSSSEVDIVVSAIVGSAGLLPTLAAINTGKRVLLANKESLVMAGALFMRAVSDSGALLLPIDSEHNAIYQCLPNIGQDENLSTVKKLLLSASGGPFQNWSMEKMKSATPQQACNHPNWKMGRKISVDSATMMNKGLEVIEASWLFNMEPNKIDVVVHQQSIVHSLVQYIDGSVLAQLGNPDMRTPIAHALAWPDRMNAGVADLDLYERARLDFERPNLIKFPCLQLAYQAAERGADAPTILNASNEVAVQAFLNGRIDFTQIAEVVDHTLCMMDFREPESLAIVQESDHRARAHSMAFIKQMGC